MHGQEDDVEVVAGEIGDDARQARSASRGGRPALLATRLMRGFLFGVTPHDPVTLIGVALTMTLVGIGACWLPARRAAGIDPAVAIRRQ
jgi:hypothetical protein